MKKISCSFETLSRVLIHDSERNRLILNDVSDERKGFVLWKDNLEERLV